MKKYLIIPVLFLFFLSACTFIFPAQTNISIAKVDFQDADTLSVYLRHAEEGFFVTVNGETYDCVKVDDPPDTLHCSGPSFKPGEEVTIRFYEDDKTTKPFASVDFVVPEYDPEVEDSDGDGLPDAEDLCPADPKKTAPGDCGCGVADTDTDGDGTPDCSDGCPENPEMTKPGENGCKAVEKDSDDDGIPDSEDKCPDDPEKNEPGVCGCGTPDTDEDDDGITDCEDICPTIAYSDLIGDPCDKDEDDDGVNDGGDFCPYDPLKRAPGYCGCGFSEVDTDKDGTPDCVDQCPEDKKKTEPGKCGCGVKDKDSDGDGILDCKDACPTDPKHDPVGDPCDHDEDCDGWDDWIDECPYDPLKKHPGACGCGVPEGC